MLFLINHYQYYRRYVLKQVVSDVSVGYFVVVLVTVTVNDFDLFQLMVISVTVTINLKHTVTNLPTLMLNSDTNDALHLIATRCLGTT